LILKINLFAEEFYLQHREIFSFEAKAGIILDFYSVDYKELFKNDNSSKFESKLNMSPIISFGIDYSITEKLHSNINFALYKSKALFQAENFFFAREETSLEIIKVKTKEVFDYSLDIYTISAGLSYEIFPRVINGPLKIGTSLSFNFLSNEFENYEEILSPETSVFIIDGKTTRKRELSKGKNNNINRPIYGLLFSLEHFLKVSRNMYFTQSISYSPYLQSISKDYNWHLNSLSFTLGLRISIIKEMANPLEP